MEKDNKQLKINAIINIFLVIAMVYGSKAIKRWAELQKEKLKDRP